jgi:hypothetical protein
VSSAEEGETAFVATRCATHGSEVRPASVVCFSAVSWTEIETTALFVASFCACVPEGPKAEPRAEPVVSLVAPPSGPMLDTTFTDDFERVELGPDWHALSESWRIDAGRLCVRGAKNRGAWLRRRLPVDARIEFDAIALSDDADLKVELWGDGRSGASGLSYSDATSYVAIFGGWKNSQHVFARLDEHGEDRIALPIDPASSDPKLRPVVPQRSYRFRFERRQGNMLTWSVDDVLLVELVDDEPLAGAGHEHFAFNDWTSPVCFDNLSIVPL